MITCKYQNGNTTSLRHVVTGVILIKNGKILLEKRGTYNGKPILESGKWAIIGGYLDRDETTKEGVVRETREETGYKIKNLKLLHINDNPDRPGEDNQNVAFVYIASPISNTSVDTEEVLETKWFDLGKLPPISEMAFDHMNEINIYKKYIKGDIKIPVID